MAPRLILSFDVSRCTNIYMPKNPIQSIETQTKSPIIYRNMVTKLDPVYHDWL